MDPIRRVVYVPAVAPAASFEAPEGEAAPLQDAAGALLRAGLALALGFALALPAWAQEIKLGSLNDLTGPTSDVGKDAALGIRDNLVRYSCGVEDADDLIRDIEQALLRV